MPDAPKITDPEGSKGGIYASPTEATSELREYFKGWTTQLTQRSFEMSMAVIAANWAVFGGLNALLANGWAKASLVTVVVGLLATLVATWGMGELLRHRITYAEKDPERWSRECDETRGTADPWPFTKDIDLLGTTLRIVKTFVPIVAGILFFLALAT